MKKYIFILIASFVCTALPLSAQATHGVYSTAEDTYQKSVLQLGASPSHGGGLVFTSSFSSGAATTVRISSSQLLSSNLSGGTFVSSDSYLTTNAPAPTIRRVGTPGSDTWGNPDFDPNDLVGPLSDGTWCLLVLLTAYAAYLIYRKRKALADI